MKLPLRKQYIKSLFRRHHRRKPLTIQMPITSRCNSRCVTCNVWKQHDKTDIEPIILRQVLANDYFDEVMTVGLNGGEFTLMPNFFEVVDAVLTLPKIQSLYLISNGALPNRLFEYLHKAKDICDKRNVNLHFCLSVDGVKTIHETTRGVPNCFQRTKQILDKMQGEYKDYCHEMSIGCTISNSNVEYIWETKEFLSQYSFPVEYHCAVPNMRIGTYDAAPYYVINNEKSKLLAAEFFYIQYIESQDWNVRFQNFSNYYFLSHNGKKRLCTCEYLYRDVTIDEHLNLSLCAKGSRTLGNLQSQDVKSIIPSSTVKNEIKRLRKECDTCIHYSYHPHTLKGRWTFIKDYVPRQYAYAFYETITKAGLKKYYKITKIYYHMFRQACTLFRML